MKNKRSSSSKFSLKQKKDFPVSPKKPEPKQALKLPKFFCPQPINYNSGISQNDNTSLERINIMATPKRANEFGFLGNPYLNGIGSEYLNWFKDEPSQVSKMSENGGKEKSKINKFEPNNFLLNKIDNLRDDFFKPKNNENNRNNKINLNYNINNCNYLINYINGNINNWTPEKSTNLNLNMNMNMNTPLNNNNVKNDNNKSNSGTKFFTSHNYGYKCSCSKTQCNRKYCECFNSGNYCIDCNCKNCNNKPPVNSYTNKHPDDSSKSKKEKIICTCTKSACNKNYCECFKSGQKCSSLCRCISCENNDDIKHKNKVNYECCPANSIYIIKNNIIVEDIKHEKEKEQYELYMGPTGKGDAAIINKKRKREEIKNSNNNENEYDSFNDSLFDKNGKVILRHINFINV